MRKTNFILALLMVFGMVFMAAPTLAEDTAVTDPATEAVEETAAEAPVEASEGAADAATDAATTSDAGPMPVDGSFDKSAFELVGVPEPGGAGFQVSVTEAKRQIQDFHDFLFWVITLISLFVTALLIYVVVKFNEKANPTPAKFTHNNALEVAWTLIPAAIVVVIMVKSMGVLTTTETVPEDAELTLKITGFQWAWAYEYPDQQIEEYESYMIRDPETNEPAGNPRLLEVDEYAVIPVDTSVRLIIAARDVLHSATVPAFGFKKDAVPGALNETWVRAEKEGIYYGQCSEICGKDHAFMPLGFKVVSREAFNEWVKQRTAGDFEGENPPQLLEIEQTVEVAEATAAQ